MKNNPYCAICHNGCLGEICPFEVKNHPKKRVGPVNKDDQIQEEVIREWLNGNIRSEEITPEYLKGLRIERS